MGEAKPYVLPEGATLNSDGSVTLPLRFPIDTTDGTSVSVVTVRRKRMVDNLAVKKIDNAVDVVITLIARLTGLKETEVHKMDEADAETISTVIEGFSNPGQPTGNGAAA